MAPRTKKKEEEAPAEEASEETALVTGPVGYDDFMAPADRSQASADEAGLGSEDVEGSDIILPRVKLLQGLSPEVADEEIGEAGQLWLTPHSRPLSFKPDKKGNLEGPEALTFVPVRVYPTWRRWRDRDDGGGLMCEAAGGDLIARDESGLAGAKLRLVLEGNDVKALEWEGGTPTNSCRQCVYGPAAASSAAGKEPSSRSNPWLPKVIEYEDEDGNEVRPRIPDDLRKPQCTQAIDVLGLIAVPPSEDMPGEVVPAFISFSRTSMTAGKSLAGMVKLASGEPVWSGIYHLGTKKVTGENIYFVMTVKKVGHANRRLMDEARKLYEMTKIKDYRPDMSDADVPPAAEGATSATPPRDDEAAPEDDF